MSTIPVCNTIDSSGQFYTSIDSIARKTRYGIIVIISTCIVVSCSISVSISYLSKGFTAITIILLVCTLSQLSGLGGTIYQYPKNMTNCSNNTDLKLET